MDPVLIVGGGVSGLTAAYRLAQSGVPCKLFEQLPETGGLIGTERVDRCVIERGADSFVAAKPWALQLVRDLGLADQIIPSNDSRRVTYIVRDRKLLPLPEGLRLMLPTRLEPVLASPLFSDACKQDLQQKWEQARPAPLENDESLAAFTRRHFNEEWLEYLAEPLLAGVFGGDPERLSAFSVFPQLREWERAGGRFASESNASGPLFWSLRDGMGALTGALRQAVDGSIHVGRVTAIEGPPWRARVDNSWHAASGLILACPAYEAARLLVQHASLSNALREIPYTSAATLALGFDREAVSHPLNGFGFLTPARERRSVAACTWVGVKWDHRVAPDKVVLRCFFGAPGPDPILQPSEDQFVAGAREELSELMDVHATPRFARLSRWPDSMPQYTLGHAQRIKRIETLTAQLPGLYLSSNYYRGVGIPDSVHRAEETVKCILDYGTKVVSDAR